MGSGVLCGDTLLLWGLFGDTSQPSLPRAGLAGVRLWCSVPLLRQRLPLASTDRPHRCWCLGRNKIKEVPGACGLVIGAGKRRAKHMTDASGVVEPGRGSGHGEVAPAHEGAGTISKLPEKHF